MPGCPDAEVCGQVHKARAFVHSEHLTSLYPGVGQGWASLSNSLGNQLLTQSMGWRSEMLNRRLGFSKSAKD